MSWLDPPPRVNKPLPPGLKRLPASVLPRRAFLFMGIAALVTGFLTAGIGFILGSFFNLRIIMTLGFGLIGGLIGANSARFLIHLAAQASEKNVKTS